MVKTNGEQTRLELDRAQVRAEQPRSDQRRAAQSRVLHRRLFGALAQFEAPSQVRASPSQRVCIIADL